MEACSLVLCLLSAITGLIYLYLSWNFNFWKKRGVTGPAPKLIYGTLPCIVKQNRNLAFDLQDLYEKYKNTGERFIGIFMTRNPQIMVTDPSLAREIYVTHFKNFRFNEQYFWPDRKVEEVSTRNPFLSPASKWKATRSDIISGLTHSRLKQAHPIVNEMCKKFTNYIKATTQKTGKTFEIKSLCFKYTFEIVADFVWGLKADTLKIDDDGSQNQLLIMSRKMIETSFMHIGLYYILGLAPFLRKVFPRRLFPEDTDNFFSQLTKDAVEMRLRNKTDRSDFLNYLIQLQEKKNISHMDMVGHSITVLLDASESTASMMAHTLYYLAINQKAQQKLREEIMANLDENGFIDYDVLVELPYLDQCLHETIRIVTLVSVSSKMCSEDIFLENRENHKVKIERGMIVHIPTYAFHHDPEVYPNPEEFIPERFDNGRAKELNQKGYFFPFGDGPRICVGMRLGLFEAKAGIVEVLKNFNLKKAPGDCVKKIDPTSFSLGLAGDVFVEIEAIN